VEADAFNTGVLFASRALFDAIREDVQAGGGGTFGGVQPLADRGLARVFDIGSRFWIDVDDTLAFEQAEIEQSRIGGMPHLGATSSR